MGYSHYWYRSAELDSEKFVMFTRDVQALLEALPPRTDSAGGFFEKSPLVIGDWDGNGDPVITDDLVSFNGASTHDGVRLSHETFRVPQQLGPGECWSPDGEGRYFESCKTERKPYDLFVTASLVALTHHFPRVAVKSDGDAGEWSSGVALYRSLFKDRELPTSGPWVRRKVRS